MPRANARAEPCYSESFRASFSILVHLDDICPMPSSSRPERRIRGKDMLGASDSIQDLDH